MTAAVCAVAHAEVIDLKGTIKAVDTSARTIAIERKTPNGTKTLELEVTKKAGDLCTVKVGDTISLSYDPDLEVVTKLGAGQQAQQAHGTTAGVIALQELDGAGHEDQPWVSPDGLTIYWTTQKPGEKKQIWTASRSKPDLLAEVKLHAVEGGSRIEAPRDEFRSVVYPDRLLLAL